MKALHGHHGGRRPSPSFTVKPPWPRHSTKSWTHADVAPSQLLPRAREAGAEAIHSFAHAFTHSLSSSLSGQLPGVQEVVALWGTEALKVTVNRGCFQSMGPLCLF